MNLSYLFECHFNDGTVFQQTQEDLSTVDATKNAFFDVMQRSDDVQSFGVYNDEHTYAVDLRDGHFEIDGVPFNARPDGVPDEHTDFRLIFFKRHTHTVVQGMSFDDADHTIDYHIGWQTTIDGKNFKQTISIK